MRNAVLRYIHKHHLIKAGDRIGVAVSGGADSVALLRLLAELREEMGVLLSVAHFNHKIRGDESDEDEQFVTELAAKLGLADELHVGSGDTLALSKTRRLSVEHAARELRLHFFQSLIESGQVTRIATAHTVNDQAETFLMRLLRGAGTRGLAGIHPHQRDKELIRPFLSVTRAQVEEYLKELGQGWREDRTNRDLQHTRNRIRHELLPLLKRDYNLAVVGVLAREADVARDEEEYWAAETSRLLPLVLQEGVPVRGGGRARSGAEQYGIDAQQLLRHPLALQRRLLRAIAAKLGIPVDVEHVDAVLSVAMGSSKSANLPSRWRVERSARELSILHAASDRTETRSYELPLAVPGEVSVPAMHIVVRARLEDWEAEKGRGTLGANFSEIDPGSLRVRDWRAGDRFLLPHSRSAKKVKDLLQELRVPQPDRAGWPVVTAGSELVAVHGLPQRVLKIPTEAGLQRLVIEFKLEGETV